MEKEEAEEQEEQEVEEVKEAEEKFGFEFPTFSMEDVIDTSLFNFEI